MIPFATEFPVKEISKGSFVALVTGWLKGTRYSKLFDSSANAKFDKENTQIVSQTGEDLRFLEYQGDNGDYSIGFRYDNPDSDGRTWRTELVVLHRPTSAFPVILRTRTQCIARTVDAVLEIPKKPYLIKSFIDDNLVDDDGYFSVSAKPHLIPDSEYGLEVAAEIAVGAATNHLPVVYVSRNDDGTLPLDQDGLSKLAFDIGGIAHLVVEPSRDFSFKLRDKTDAQNVYGGSVGVFIPNGKRPRKFYIGGAISNSAELATWLIDYCVSVRSRIPPIGWDWTELHEQALRAQRLRDRNRLSSQEIEDSYNEEIQTLKERVLELETRLRAGDNAATEQNSAMALGLDEFPHFQELYQGESMDRILFLLQVAMSVKEPQGIDPRSAAFAENILKKVAPSSGLSILKNQLSQAAKDMRKSGEQMAAILNDLGFHRKSDKNHIRMEPDASLLAVSSVTLSKTPSDARTPKNHKSQIENALGIAKLS